MPACVSDAAAAGGTSQQGIKVVARTLIEVTSATFPHTTQQLIDSNGVNDQHDVARHIVSHGY
jgi:hypothetical protein